VNNPRQMIRAELNGRHAFPINENWQAQLYKRDDRYVLRWRQGGRQRGCTLDAGSDVAAELEIRSILERLSNGTFRRKSRSQHGPSAIPILSLDELFDRFLDEKRNIRGGHTAKNYASRLAHVRAFTSTTAGKARSRDASLIDRAFVMELKQFLGSRLVTRNGCSSGAQTVMSPKLQCLILELLRDVFTWAMRPSVRLLSNTFCMPVDANMIPEVPQKPLVRPNPVPIAKRIAMVQLMDRWQLQNLCTLLTLPTRIEDISGALISDFNLEISEWRIGPRFAGNDFNKNRLDVTIPLPAIVADLLRHNVLERGEGPMFLRRQPNLRRATWPSREALERHIAGLFAAARKCTLTAPGDRKKLIRTEIARLGGVSENAISREASLLLRRVGVVARTYDLRAATTDDLKRSGSSHLELRYLTLHSVSDILTTYASVDPSSTMERYFEHIAPLLDAMRQRAIELELLPSAP
jgi:hypothetical protein